MEGGELAIHRQIQGAYKCVAKQYEEWNNTEKDVKSSISRLINLAEQYRSVKTVSINEHDIGPLFPDVKERLICKLMTQMDACVQHINKTIVSEDAIVSEVHRQYHQCMDRYHQHGEEVPDVCDNTGQWPTMAAMIHTLQQIYMLFFNLHHSRCYHVDNLDLNEESSVLSLNKSWQSNNQLTETLQVSLAQVANHQKENFQKDR